MNTNLKGMTPRELAAAYILAMRYPVLINAVAYEIEEACEAQVGDVTTLKLIEEARESFMSLDVPANLEPSCEPVLDESLRKQIKAALESLYPHLYFSESLRAVWVRQDDRDGTSIAYGDVFSMNLNEYERQAARSLTVGWFFCSGHKKAEPYGLYDYYHFSGRYCRDWGNAHPKDRRAAQSESYE